MKFHASSQEKLLPVYRFHIVPIVVYQKFEEWKPSQIQTLFDADFATQRLRMVIDCFVIVSLWWA